MKTKIILVNGYPRSGKDSFIDAAIQYLHSLQDKKYFGLKLSSVDKVKSAALMLGWDGKKTPKARKFLADLKNLSTEAFDHPFHYVTSTISKARPDIAFILVREVGEIERLRKYYKESEHTVIVVRIVGKYEDRSLTNVADSAVDDYKDYEIFFNNFGTLEEWQRDAQGFIKYLLRIKETKKLVSFWSKFDDCFSGLTKRLK